MIYVGLVWFPIRDSCLFVVSDWGSYLGSHFLIVLCGILTMYSCLVALLASRFVCALLFCLASFDLLKYVELYAHCSSNHYNDRDIKNVKCQNNSRELFISGFISFITFPVGQKFTYQILIECSIAFKLFNLGQTCREAFHKLPTISWVNFGPFLLIELV